MITHILVVDDDPVTQCIIQEQLRRQDCYITLAGNAKEMRRNLNDKTFDVVFLDIQLPDGNGIDLLSEIVGTHPDLPVIMITSHGSVEIAVDAMRKGAYDFCPKPINWERLHVSFKNAIERSTLKKKIKTLEKTRRRSLCDLIGGSSEMQVVYHIVETVAPTKASVMITGESGTGKELVARAIHQLSPRRHNMLVDVNCAAIPKDLMESELFGHEKASFTGAMKQYIGRCEQADQGTLFLDEIAEMDINLQSKLLRFLQERSFYRIGGKQRLQVDTRVISATNREPLAAIQENHLREDLYYRLNVVHIHIPPLRERQEDIPQLAHYFLRKYCEENLKDFVEISNEAEEAMRRYPWPGNVRELENCIQYAVVLNQGKVLERSMLPEPACSSGPVRSDASLQPPQQADSYLNLESKEIIPLETLERNAIEQALRITHGNVSRAAVGLRLSQATLYRKIRDFGFNPKNYKFAGDRDEDEESLKESLRE